MTWIKAKVVKVRKDHECLACGQTIKKGEKAFYICSMYHTWSKVPIPEYYHYSPKFTAKQIMYMLPNDIRKEICEKRN
jgi:hypothetical protein